MTRLTDAELPPASDSVVDAHVDVDVDAAINDHPLRYIAALARRIRDDAALIADPAVGDGEDLPPRRAAFLDRKPLEYAWDDVLELLQSAPPLLSATSGHGAPPCPSNRESRCFVLNRKITTRAAFDGICDRVQLLKHHVEVMRSDDSAERLAHDHAVMGQVLEELDVLLRVVALAAFEEQLYRWAVPRPDLKS